MSLSAEDRLVRARHRLDRAGIVAADLLPPAIGESWRRCLAAGLDPRRPPPPTIVGRAALEAAHERTHALRRLALVEMESLHRQIAGTNFMIAFADAGGLLLDTITDASFAETARASRIVPGTLWTESQCGTNALGTVAATGCCIMVHGAEHFFASHGGLTCIAAPVFDPDGRLAGVLDASSDCRSRQEHTRALVGMAARQIENGLFRDAHRADLLVVFHSRSEYLHTQGAGLLAFDPAGTLLAANTQARFLLQGLPATPGRHFAELFRSGFAAFRDAAPSGEPQPLEDRLGSVFAARMESLRPPRPVAMPKAPPPRPSLCGFVADDPAVAAVVRAVAAAARRGVPILLRGETGTGKEQLARHAHAASGRRGAFVPVNCAALPDGLVEAELFGHADGAFTGARRGGAPGLVAGADSGTLFLDEIGEMRRELQAVLLRLLDDWTLRPVGGGRPRRVDVLLVAATNIDLDEAVAQGRFRADLHYRLNTLEVMLPPLRERADFAAIVDHLLAAVAPHGRITPEAVAALRARPWRGNIRELRSALTRLTLADPAAPIGAEAVAALPGGPGAAPSTEAAGLRALLRERIATIHRASGGNVSEAARRLGVSRNTVYRALERSRS